MNIGAWDHAWRKYPDHDAYLFLQDECSPIRDGWLSAYVSKGEEYGVGLVGESINEKWVRSWDGLKRMWEGHEMPDHLLNGMVVNRIDLYLDFLERIGIPPGSDGAHLRALVWYAKRSVLKQIGGFPTGRTLGECIASEIAVSKKVQAVGLQAVQVATMPFTYFAHRELIQDSEQGSSFYRKLV